jgi:hypothetical protein
MGCSLAFGGPVEYNMVVRIARQELRQRKGYEALIVGGSIGRKVIPTTEGQAGSRKRSLVCPRELNVK